MSTSLLEEPVEEQKIEHSSAFNAIKRGFNAYKTLAVLALNTVLLLIGINVFSFVALHFLEKDTQKKEDQLTAELFTKKYPDYTEPQLKELMREKRRGRSFEYAPFVGYKYRPVFNDYLHIDANGFRRASDTGFWPPDARNFNIFVFGASTTFGTGVTDDETITANLQKYLKARGTKNAQVYNFGTSGYNSSTERIQFSNLLAKGIKPDIAVFIDGNLEASSFTDDPPLTNEFKEMFEDRGHGLAKSLKPFFHDLPMTKLSEKMKELGAKKHGPARKIRFTPDQIKHITSRYIENKRLIEAQAKAYDVATLFVWQPSPSYKYDLKLHPFPGPSFPTPDHAPTSEAMAKIAQESTPEFTSDFLWLADMQENAKEPCYIDISHYRAGFCKAIGDAIGQCLIDRKYIKYVVQ